MKRVEPATGMRNGIAKYVWLQRVNIPIGGFDMASFCVALKKFREHACELIVLFSMRIRSLHGVHLVQPLAALRARFTGRVGMCLT